MHLLGAPRMSGPAGERASKLLAKPKAFALFAYLALAGRRGPRRRDEILALFWPESDTERARNSLRQALFLIKGHLPEGTLVSTGHETVGLAGVDVDVDRFERLLDESHERDAMALYAGPLLDGFRLYADSDFDAWLTIERERVQARAVRGAMSLARRGGGGDAFSDADAERWMRTALDLAPYDEALLRDVMELAHQRGAQSSARSLFDAASRRFETELGIALSPETQQSGRSLAVAVPPAPPPLIPRLQPRAVDAEARRIYLTARGFAGQRSPRTIMKAIDGFQRALAISPEYAESHAGLAFAYCQAVVYVDYPGTDAWPLAKAHAQRAIRLDPQLGEAHAVLAQVTLCYDYDWTAAEVLYRKALEVDPTSLIARQLYALYFLTGTGRLDEALALLDRTRDDIPDNPAISVYYAMCCVFGRRFDRALQEVNFVLETHPALVQAYWVRGMALEALGDFAGAIASFEHGIAITGGSALFRSELGRALARSGDADRAREILAQLDSTGGDAGPTLYTSVEILAALGDTERALDRLYAAYRQRNPFLAFAGVKYALDPLRDTQRFRDLLVRLRYPSAARGAPAQRASHAAT